MARVYVSSTVADLEAERQAVMDWLVAAQHLPVHSYWPSSETVRDSCLDDVDSCDLYVLILGHRYGFQPADGNPEGLSITQLEFRRAGRCGIPRIALLRTSIPDVSLSDLAEPQRLELVSAFRDEVAREVRPAQFNDLSELIKGLSTGVQAELAKLAAASVSAQTEPEAAAMVDLRPPRSPFPVHGRASVLSELRDLLQGRGGPRVRVLAGVGGVGKSTVAAEIARAAEDDGWRVWWVNASDPASLTGGILGILGEMGAAPGLKALVQNGTPTAAWRTWEFLNSPHSAERPWLLVFDNADSPEVLAAPGERSPADGRGWLPSDPSGVVIVTTRRKGDHWWGPQVVRRLDPLDLAAAGRTLCDRASGAGNLEQAITLGRRLGNLPLALHLAGSLLAGPRSPWHSFGEYCSALEGDESLDALTYMDPPDAKARVTVERTWELSLDALAKNGLAQARPILMLLACFAPRTPIPRSMLNAELLTRLPGLGDDHTGTAVDEDTALRRRFWAGVGALDDVGLIEMTTDKQSIVVLPVIADASRIRLYATDGSYLYAVGSTAIRILTAAVDRLLSEAQVSQDKLRSSVPHVMALLETIADKLDADSLTVLVSVSHRIIQQLLTKSPAVAEHLARASIHALDRSGDDGLQVVALRRDLAKALARQGRAREAEQLLSELFAAEERLADLDPREILETRQELASTIEYQSRYKEAERLYHELIRDESRILSKDDLLLTETRFRLAFTIGLRDRRRAHQAEWHFQKVFRDRRRLLTDRDARTVQARHGIAWSWALQGRWAEAETEFRKVMADRMALSGVGQDDSQTMATRYRVGWVLAGQGRYQEAEQTLSEVAADQARILGRDSQATLRTRYRHARAIFDQGEPRRHEAETLFTELLADQREVLGETHQATLRTRYRLALAAEATTEHDREEARRLLGALLADQRRLLGADHPDTQDTQDALARLAS